MRGKLLLTSLMALFLLPAVAQTSQQKKPQESRQKQEKVDKREPGDSIAIETTEVLLPVTVRDSSGQFVTHSQFSFLRNINFYNFHNSRG